MLSDNLVYEVLAAFERAETAKDYRKAKQGAARLGRLGQLAVVDSVRATRARLEAKGVL